MASASGEPVMKLSSMKGMMSALRIGSISKKTSHRVSKYQTYNGD